MRLLLLLLAFFVSSAGLAEEGALNRMLAPGPLIEGHKQLEETGCLECHTFKRDIPDANCLECHKDIARADATDSGFHGRRKKRCIECHLDHKGRNFDPTKFDTKGFDHRETGFELTGKHKSIACEKCHTETRKGKPVRPSGTRFLGLSGRTCVACHQADSVHGTKGRFSKDDCGKCHTTQSWSQIGAFDHAKTGFPLTGSHKSLTCEKCHQPGKSEKGRMLQGKPVCASCHRKDNVHGASGMFAVRDCGSCHATNSWKVGKFDHGKRTGYVLQGSHAKLKCQSCHTGNDAKLKNVQETSCATCHGAAHGLEVDKLTAKNNCGKCHNQKSWDIWQFNHGAVAGYALKGRHEKLECVKCHKQDKSALAKGPKAYVWKELSRNCASCHSDPHGFDNPEFKKCSTCHNELSWKKGMTFNHTTQTEFPLNGKHVSVACVKCHEASGKSDGVVTRKYQFPELKTKSCATCHRNPHDAQFMARNAGKNCASCHDASGWKKMISGTQTFSHDRDTRFPLTGKHKQVSCDSCHARSGPDKKVYRFPIVGGDFCANCHDNVHKGEFSPEFSKKACSSCHTTESFGRQKPFDHSATDFDLRGKHRSLACQKCHVATRRVAKNGRAKHRYLFPNLHEESCASCHKDPHEGEFGAACASCHVESSFKATKDFHKNFQLSGVHNSLECSQCHLEGKRLSGTGTNCVACHQKDDVHGGSLPNCKECHSQVYWEATTFSHSFTGFPLRGAHRTLECSSCHATGMYKGTPTECFACHAKDAARVSTPAHSMPAYRRCEKCHSSFGF